MSRVESQKKGMCFIVLLTFDIFVALVISTSDFHVDFKAVF